MSVPLGIEQDATGLTLRERAAARVVVPVARVLAKRKPQRLQRFMTLISRGARPATHEQASRARAAVTSTSVVCAAPEGCLPRSIATALSLRLRGVFPTWAVGVRVMPPFGAHAWVMVDGRDVDEPHPQGYYVALMKVDPR